MSYESEISSDIPNTHSYTTFNESDEILCKQNLKLHGIYCSVTSPHSRIKKSVRFRSTEHLKKVEDTEKINIDSRKQDQRKYERITQQNDTITLVHQEPKPPMKYKLYDKMRKKLHKRTPVISGHTLEHYYRYGKPPFLNYGYLRNLKLTRY